MEYEGVINRVLKQCDNQEKRHLLVTDLEKRANANLFAAHEFEWIKADERICFWVCSFLRTAAISSIFNTLNPRRAPESNSPGPSRSPYEIFEIRELPSNTRERLDAIIEYFDSLEVSNRSKVRLNDWLKGLWSTVILMPDCHKWLDMKNKEQCDWAWAYMIDKTKPVPCWFLNPTSFYEKGGALIAALDSWNIDADNKESFIIKMKSAWSQQKQRSKMKNNKSAISQ